VALKPKEARQGFVGVLDAAIKYFDKPNLSAILRADEDSFDDSLEEEVKAFNLKPSRIKDEKSELDLLRSQLERKNQGHF
jgi:hypothetical protein